MKNLSAHPRRRISDYVPYPNGATRQQVLDKCLNRLLILASCLGFAAIILFLVAMS